MKTESFFLYLLELYQEYVLDAVMGNVEKEKQNVIVQKTVEK